MQSSTEQTIPKYSKFVQQELPAWRPIITQIKAIILLFVIAIFAFISGSIFYVSAKNTIEIETRYDDKCELNKICNLTLEIPQKIKGKVILKYKLTRFYQNHRRYMESRSREQLSGNYVDFKGMSTCDPMRSINGSSSDSNWILPCGLSAVTLFNDTFYVNISGFSEKGIAWESDKEYMYKKLNSKYSGGYRWLDDLNYTFPGGTTNEHFIVWMRTSA